MHNIQKKKNFCEEDYIMAKKINRVRRRFKNSVACYATEANKPKNIFNQRRRINDCEEDLEEDFLPLYSCKFFINSLPIF